MSPSRPLDEINVQLLACINKVEKASIGYLSEKVFLTPDAVRRRLKSLHNKGFICRENKPSAAHYFYISPDFDMNLLKNNSFWNMSERYENLLSLTEQQIFVILILALLELTSSTNIAQVTNIKESSVRSALGKLFDKKLINRKLRNDRQNSYVYLLDDKVSVQEVIDTVSKRNLKEKFLNISTQQGFRFSFEDKTLIRLPEILSSKSIEKAVETMKNRDTPFPEEINNKINSLKPKQIKVLEYICDNPGSTVKKIAEGTDIPESSMHCYLVALLDFNLVERDSIPLNPGHQYEYCSLPEVKKLILDNNFSREKPRSPEFNESLSSQVQHEHHTDKELHPELDKGFGLEGAELGLAHNPSSRRTRRRASTNLNEHKVSVSPIERFSTKLKKLAELNQELNSLKQELIAEGGETTKDLIDQYILQ
jgi:predicted transcriptional regulator